MFSNRVFFRACDTFDRFHLVAVKNTGGGEGNAGKNRSDERGALRINSLEIVNRYPGRSSASGACCK